MSKVIINDKDLKKAVDRLEHPSKYKVQKTKEFLDVEEYEAKKAEYIEVKKEIKKLESKRYILGQLLGNCEVYNGRSR